MATTTTNLGLKKPAGTDQALISDINNNMDILDTKIGAVGNTSVQSQITSLSDQIVMETLSSGTDLDTLSGYSYEKWFTGTNITQMTNYPSGIGASAFALQIIKLGNYYKQTLHVLDANRNIYERTQYYSGSVKWGSWSSFTDHLAKFDTPSSGAANLNDCKSPGFYRADGSTANKPAGAYMAVLVMPYGQNDLAQFGIDVNNGTAYIRVFKDGTTWTSWKTVSAT